MRPAARAAVPLAGLAFVLAGLEPRAHSQAPGAGFTTSTTAVVVDVVVRDAKGAPIVDLKPGDFELLENDVQQRIASVELIAPGRAQDASRAAGNNTPTGTPAVSIDGADTTTSRAATQSTVLALVFHRLSAEGRTLAHRAATAYLKTGAQPGDYAGVFVIDTRLETLQAFTTDVTKLAAAIERAALTQAADTTRHQPMSTLFGDSSPDVSPTASAESIGRPLREPGFVPRMQAPSAGPRNPRADSQGIVQRLGEHMERAYEEMMRDRNGNAESAALTALATAMGSLPGRKSIVLFSEGIAVPDTIATKFRAVVDTANRGNVTIYAVDAKGLRLHSEQAATARGLAELRGVGDDDQRPEMVTERDRRSARTSDLERGAFLLNKDPAASLGTLAKDTGGFLVNNTNDLASAFTRIDADRRFHYLLTYTPLDTSMNGAFRRIAVKVKRRGASVRARSGYIALPMLGTVPVLRFESNALSALGATPRPTQVQLRAAVFQFPEADGKTRVALYVQAPGSGVAYFVDDKQTAWQTHFTILARIVDDTGETIRKGSQPYRLTGPAKDVHVARQGDILFYRQPTLEPGRYTIDYALYDELSGQAGAGALPLLVETREPSALAMSDVVLVDRAEAVPPDQRDTANPLYLGSTLIYPNLGTPIVRSTRGSLVFFYTARAGTRPLTGRVELIQDGHAIATRALVVPPSGDDGLVQHANELPLDEIGAGPYELRVTLSDGSSTVTRSTPFTLLP
jgi:VWFA-related protein